MQGLVLEQAAQGWPAKRGGGPTLPQQLVRRRFLGAAAASGSVPLLALLRCLVAPPETTSTAPWRAPAPVHSDSQRTIDCVAVAGWSTALASANVSSGDDTCAGGLRLAAPTVWQSGTRRMQPAEEPRVRLRALV
jgi:hypothetical protein